MIADLRCDEIGDEIRAEFCIVGAGAAGVTLALALAQRGRSVILLESGGIAFEDDSQDLYMGASIGHPMDMDHGRVRQLGGATTAWTGRCITLDPIDFEARDWVPHSGWPIAYEEVARFYPAAARACGFEEPWIDDDAALGSLGLRRGDFDADAARLLVWRYAPQRGRRRYRDWGHDHLGALRASPHLRLLLHANAVSFEPTPAGGRVAALQAASLNGKRVRVAAEDYVLCCGGGENARLLMHAEAEASGALGAGLAMAGRFFMQHPRGSIAQVQARGDQARRLQDMFNVFARRTATQYEVGFGLPEAVQRRERLLNASVILRYEAAEHSAWSRFKAGLRAGDVKTLAEALRTPSEIIENLWRRGLEGRHPLLAASRIDVEIDLEQAPNPDSRLVLSQERDALGMRRLVADWRIGAQEVTTASRFEELLRAAFARHDLGMLERAAWLDDGVRDARDLFGTFHHLCGTRMSRSAKDGVVDGQCRVHGSDNLYAQGASVFATGGHGNPTLTIVALALRQAEILLLRRS